MCLATAIFFEAGIEPVDGKVAVADVILNRVEDRRYPDDICAVVFEPNQFSFTHDGKPDVLGNGPLATESLKVAEEVMEGRTLGLTSTHYHAAYVAPSWKKAFDFDGKVGLHYFYTNNTRYR